MAGKKITNSTVWIPLWHIYQPPHQSKYWVEKIAKESYEQIIQIYKKHPNAKFILNINASLTLLFKKYKLDHIIEGIKELAKKGQCEFVSTLAYHPIAPLIPEREITRQIKLNDKIHKEIFGDAYNPTGVWLPEMAYAKKVIRPIAKLGYKWISLAGVASNGTWTNTGYTYVKQGNFKLNVLFRDDSVSLDIAFGKTGNFINLLKGRKGKFVFTTVDGETIGHHQKHLVNALDSWLTVIDKDETLTTMDSKELFESFKCKSESLALPSSWSTTYQDILSGNFYPLWLEQNQEPYKTAHKLAWDHLYNLMAAVKEVEKSLPQTKIAQFEEVRNLLDNCLFSCSYWWFTREKSHTNVPMFLSNIDMQGRAMRMLLEIKNHEKIHDYAEQNEEVREKIFELLNNYS